MPRVSRIAAREAAAIPFPREDTTPPVTNTYFVMAANDTGKGLLRQITVTAMRLFSCKTQPANLACPSLRPLPPLVFGGPFKLQTHAAHPLYPLFVIPSAG